MLGLRPRARRGDRTARTMQNGVLKTLVSTDMESPKPTPTPDEVKSQISLWQSVVLEQGSRSDLWGLEALRNLVLLNAAGLAGAMTAFQVKAVTEHMFWPAAGFLFGIGMGCLSIALGWVLHRLAAQRYQSNGKAYVESGDLAVLFQLNARLLLGINIVSIVTGIVSFCAFFFGAYRLLTAFF